MDLTTATPVEIDTELLKLDVEMYKLEDRLHRAWHNAYRTAGAKQVFKTRGTGWSMTLGDAMSKLRQVADTDTTYVGEQAKRVLADVADAVQAIAVNKSQRQAFEDEYDSRPWTRAFLAVTNGAGHVHSSEDCSTCNNGQYRTRFARQPQYSGAEEALIVADAGYRACTVCYVTAPVEATPESHPTKIFSQDELDAAKARDARAVAKAKRDADKIAKSLTPDGSELVVPNSYGSREHFKTERAATTWVVQEIGWKSMNGNAMSQEGIDIVVSAIAAKHGKSIEDVKADIDAKVKTWRKRNS